MWNKLEAWSHGVCNLAKTAKQYPQFEYSILGMSLQLEWKYLKRTVPGVGTIMVPIEDVLIEAFFPALFRWAEVSVSTDHRGILGHSMK